jgi:hypothetical protein
MAIYETIDRQQANRCEKAQRENKKITEVFETPAGPSTIAGKIQSVVMNLQSYPQRWMITVTQE